MAVWAKDGFGIQNGALSSLIHRICSLFSCNLKQAVFTLRHFKWSRFWQQP